eukprot:TRINITY_DN6069_c0_g1_i1.p1 TRINITY_DN6069_c0_g1~~TRINITY_DN6069_c0_g1_i1.p1  ORF type:complete len:611 (-),score=151.05 TRINITY_DN6069_c0_g1_i1:515-2347(-)
MAKMVDGVNRTSPAMSLMQRLSTAHGVLLPLWVSQLPMLCNLLMGDGAGMTDSMTNSYAFTTLSTSHTGRRHASPLSSPLPLEGGRRAVASPRPFAGTSRKITGATTPTESAPASPSMARLAATMMTALALVGAGSSAKRRGLKFPKLLRRAGSKSRVDAASNEKIVIAPGEKWRKWSTFWCAFFGYAVFYFTRQSLGYTAPVLKEAMGWTGLSELGKLSSLFPLAYGTSRFIGGVLGDRMSPKNVFIFGLTACGLLNIAFGCSSSLFFFALFWVLNGSLQGLGAPPCVKMLTNWFDASERGTWWAVWHASINLGGFIIPFLAGGLAQNFGWRYGMLGPGFVALAFAAICLVLMKDGPDSMKAAKEKAAADKAAAAAAPKDGAAGDAAVKQPEKEVGLVEGLFMNPLMWSLASAYALQYICRTGLQLWGVFFLMHQGVPTPAKAAALFSGYELGGFFGNLTAGAISDKLLQRSRPDQGQPGQRAKVAFVYLTTVAFLMPLLMKVPPSAAWLQYVTLFAIGHFVAGTQLLLPLIAAEIAPPNLLATSNGFMGWVGYFGAASAGLPLSVAVTKVGWSGFFSLMAAAAAAGGVLLLPLRNARSWKQRQQLANA